MAYKRHLETHSLTIFNMINSTKELLLCHSRKMAYPQPVNILPSPSLSHRSHRSERSHSQSQRSMHSSRASMRSSANGIPIAECKYCRKGSRIFLPEKGVGIQNQKLFARDRVRVKLNFSHCEYIENIILYIVGVTRKPLSHFLLLFRRGQKLI